MKSTEGRYYPNLDHVRALAAFLVFSWHFTTDGIPAGGHTSIPIFAAIAQGHCGVSLFMVLSAYLFTKLLTGREISIPRFYYNRAIRLFPLLIVVLCLYGFIDYQHGKSVMGYLTKLLDGFVMPTWPGGAWSITTELHFYILLPLLLAILRTRPGAFAILIFAAVLLRSAIWFFNGSVQTLAYFTLVGRIDQFLFGMLAAKIGSQMKGRHWPALVTLIAFMAVYFILDRAGGFLHMPIYPSPSPAWIFIPTIEGLTFAILIAYYDITFSFGNSWLSRAVAWAGTVSFSVYLLHPFVLKSMFRALRVIGLALSSVDLAMAVSVAGYIVLLPLAWLSYRLIETPFLKLRVRYMEKTS